RLWAAQPGLKHKMTKFSEVRFSPCSSQIQPAFCELLMSKPAASGFAKRGHSRGDLPMLKIAQYILGAGLMIGASTASAGDLMPDSADGIMNSCRSDYHRMCSY